MAYLFLVRSMQRVNHNKGRHGGIRFSVPLWALLLVILVFSCIGAFGERLGLTRPLLICAATGVVVATAMFLPKLRRRNDQNNS